MEKDRQMINVDFPTPGEILRKEFMEPLGLSVNKLANETAVSWARIHRILDGKTKMTADMSARLSEYFGLNREFWTDLQELYDARVTERMNAVKSEAIHFAMATQRK
ncbi:MAG: HigA family addiction module antidote protein [Fusobacteriaceae bacterium]|nr:HigA family addiction module antidote protein [Fusobacteriaceae bacterium]